jgi:hypothetical protein
MTAFVDLFWVNPTALVSWRGVAPRWDDEAAR